jgi:hypothetical protein
MKSLTLGASPWRESRKEPPTPGKNKGKRGAGLQFLPTGFEVIAWQGSPRAVEAMTLRSKNAVLSQISNTYSQFIMIMFPKDQQISHARSVLLVGRFCVLRSLCSRNSIRKRFTNAIDEVPMVDGTNIHINCGVCDFGLLRPLGKMAQFENSFEAFLSVLCNDRSGRPTKCSDNRLPVSSGSSDLAESFPSNPNFCLCCRVHSGKTGRKNGLTAKRFWRRGCKTAQDQGPESEQPGQSQKGPSVVVEEDCGRIP